MTLTWRQRLTGFFICAGLGIACSLMSSMFVWNFDATHFAVTYTFGNILSISSTAFLMGPVNQVREAHAGRLTCARSHRRVRMRVRGRARVRARAHKRTCARVYARFSARTRARTRAAFVRADGGALRRGCTPYRSRKCSRPGASGRLSCTS